MNAPAQSNPCPAVRALASRYLDGRLSAPSRARVHAHLKECGACLDTYRSLQRLSTMARSLPRAAAPADLARRVRRTVSERRQETLAHLDLGTAPAPVTTASTPHIHMTRVPWRAIAIAAAVVATVSASLFAGYKLGRMEERGDTESLLAQLRTDRDRFADQLINAQGSQGSLQAPPRDDLAHGSSTKRQPALTEVDPGIWKPYREQGFRPEQFVRSAQSLWSDLASYEQLDPEVRRPLLTAQLACFDLPTQARVYERISSSGQATDAGLDEIARFVLALSTMLESENTAFEPATLLGSKDPFSTLPTGLSSSFGRLSMSEFEPRIEESVRLACTSGSAADPDVLNRVRGLLKVKSLYVGGELASEAQSMFTIYLSKTTRTNTVGWRISEDGEQQVVEESSTSSTDVPSASDGN